MEITCVRLTVVYTPLLADCIIVVLRRFISCNEHTARLRRAHQTAYEGDADNSLSY